MASAKIMAERKNKKIKENFYKKLEEIVKSLNTDDISCIFRTQKDELGNMIVERKTPLTEDITFLDAIAESILAKENPNNDDLLSVILSPVSFSVSLRLEAEKKILANSPSEDQLKQLIPEYEFIGNPAKEAKKMLEKLEKRHEKK